MGKFSRPRNRAAAAYQRRIPEGFRAEARGTCYTAASAWGDAMALDQYLLARVLFTLTTIGWGALTVLADFNKTHATNPKWLPHARFHVVWQISSYVGFGALTLALIWWPGPLALERLYLAAIVSAVVYAAFFVALFAMPIYGGAAYDTNGYKPFKAPLPLFAPKWDANITAFSIQVILLAAGTVAMLS
jgi:hypothetical protein